MGKGGGQDQDQDGMAIIYYMITLIVIVGAIYWVFNRQIIEAYFALKTFEIHLIIAFFPKLIGIIDYMDEAVQSTGLVPFEKIQYVASMTGLAYRFPATMFILLLMLIVFIFHPNTSYTEKETMKSLVSKARKSFPYLNVVEGIDLVKIPLDEGPWKMALTPVEFSKKHRLLIKDKETGTYKVNALRAGIIFSKQLGEPWEGLEALDAFERAIYGILAAYICRQRDLAGDILEKITEGLNNAKAQKGTVDVSAAVPLIAKYGKHQDVLKIVEKHHYVSTVFTALLSKARETGIVPNAGYLWLKPTKREFWYILNNVGRMASFVEVAGIRSHYTSEIDLGAPISMPMVDEAVKGLEEAISIRIIEDD